MRLQVAPSRKIKMLKLSSLMSQVRAEIELRGVDLARASKQIGVSRDTLKKHLAGEHVRSDSALKYQDWISGRKSVGRFASIEKRDRNTSPPDDLEKLILTAPTKPRLVVDIFSGCGGLSLGFDLLQDGKQFETILAIDVNREPVAVLNKNKEKFSDTELPVGRQLDLTEFSSPYEFLAFYLQHVATLKGDDETLRRLDEIGGGAFLEYRAAISSADRAFESTLMEVWQSAEWRRMMSSFNRDALSQTSVAAFQDRLKLPRLTQKNPTVRRTLWNDRHTVSGLPSSPSAEFITAAECEWEAEARELKHKQGGKGKGQLQVSARRVMEFCDLLDAEAFAPIKSAWVDWRASWLEARLLAFSGDLFQTEVRELYQSTYPVSVLVGGPPCQGFSRIGRGKIRSLHDAQMHAHSSSEAGDSRNLLFNQYVMILDALRPRSFILENVQHFKSTVKAGKGEFPATDVLAEAIANVSNDQASYQVASTVLNAARAGAPQNRIRYFMCGLRSDHHEVSEVLATANWILALPRQPEASLDLALAGLPDPHFTADGTSSRAAMEQLTEVSEISIAPSQSPYIDWVRRSQFGAQAKTTRRVDSHAARSPRSDDAALFSLISPGKRWMDYRTESASTIEELNCLVSAIINLPASVKELIKSSSAGSTWFPDDQHLNKLHSKLDGSLPIRLLLEQISAELGHDHHLLRDTYLAKRDSQHGDWLARMDPKKPSKTMVSHMSKDTYAFVHPYAARTLSVREAARIQTFPDWFSFSNVSMTDAFKMIGNAVPPFLSHLLASRMAHALESSARPALHLVKSA